MPKQRPEEQLQKAVFAYLDVALPRDAVAWHTPNQRGTRKRWENALLKGLGVRKGIPDVLVLWNGRLHCVELKAPGRKATQTQLEMAEQLKLAGGVWISATSLDGVVGALLGWGIPLRYLPERVA